MQNEILWFILLFVNFFLICGVYKLFGKLGLFIYIPIASIITNIQVVVTLDLFSMSVTLGNITYASTFLITDILSEYYSKKDARVAVIIGFCSIIIGTLLMYIVTFMIPDEAGAQMFENIKSIFSIQPRIVFASITTYLISQNVDISLFKFFKDKFPSRKYLWLRNNGSTMLSQILDNVLFNFMAFLGVFPISLIIEIVISTYVLKFIVSLLDTPFIYFAGKIKNSKPLIDV